MKGLKGRKEEEMAELMKGIKGERKVTLKVKRDIFECNGHVASILSEATRIPRQ